MFRTKSFSFSIPLSLLDVCCVLVLFMENLIGQGGNDTCAGLKLLLC